ncbi:UNVERIFIED_CONTAM: hypothetical protein K2H54_060777 [Gekko kuhli]
MAVVITVGSLDGVPHDMTGPGNIYAWCGGPGSPEEEEATTSSLQAELLSQPPVRFNKHSVLRGDGTEVLVDSQAAKKEVVVEWQ